MKLSNVYLLLFIAGLTLNYSCKKTPDAVAKLKKSCLYNIKIDYFKKWANTFTEIDSTSASGAVKHKSYIYPLGYFQLDSNSTYHVLSDYIPLSGTWTITDSCQLELDQGTSLDRKFDVLSLTNDSLTIRRKEIGVTYIQHYVAYQCPSVTQLEQQWDNTYTLQQNYSDSVTYNPFYIYPTGYFKLNADFTYNVLSDGIPLNGKWELDQDGCLLVLDKKTNLQRAFDIQKITPDSLVIWRKDTISKVNYQQHYVKN